MRPVLSYDDITDSQSLRFQISQNSSNQPQSRKRKRNNGHNKRQFGAAPVHYPQHWDDPEPSMEPVVYDDPDAREHLIDEVADEESRELTHDEIWDDSALIDAWNAATDEYERFHGPEKNWKDEPEHKSVLWYNVPLSPSRLEQSRSTTALSSTSEQQAISRPEAEHNSQPIDFDSFIPTHDPSLAQDFSEVMEANTVLPPPVYLSNVTADEAFSKALNAMYWTGYWTAIYHCRKTPNESGEEFKNQPVSQMTPNGVKLADEAQLEDEETLEVGDLVPSQR